MGKNNLQLKRRTFLKGTVGIIGSGFGLFGLNDYRNCEPTQSDMLGPYWSEQHPSRTVLANSDEPGSRIRISGIVTADDCSTPIANALVDVWHANDQGCYTIFQNCDTGNSDNDEYNLRGIMVTDENGNYSFESILPGYYPGRPRHFHYKITTPSGTELVTQCYFDNDSLISDDFASNHEDLIISLNEDNGILSGIFNISMNQSAEELSLENSNQMSPMDFKIESAYPNPFNNTIKIDYSLEKRGHVDIEIFDTNGKWIKNLVGNLMSRGKHVVIWSGDDDNGNIISSGTYLVVIRFGTRIKSKKINLIK